MTNLAKRILSGAGLGIIFGFITFIIFTKHNPNTALTVLSFSNPMLWKYLIQKEIIGFVVAIAGFITTHPCFGFKLPVFLRGLLIGFIVSVGYGMSVFVNPNLENAWIVFLMIIGAGAFTGMIIDLIITKFFGQGKELNS